MDEKYLENVYIQHYLEETDLAWRRLQSAIDRGDMEDLVASGKKLHDMATSIKNRSEKVDKGEGDKRNGGKAWNPDKLPPKAVRELPPEEVRSIDLNLGT